MNDAVKTPRPSGATLLESILFLMEPEQRKEFLSTAGAAGVVYANRAPTFQKPLAVRLSRSAFDLLRAMLLDAVQPTPGQFYRRYRLEREESRKRNDALDPDELFRRIHAEAAERTGQIDTLEQLRTDLERGVRFSPPPRDWFQTRETAKGMPIRVESRKFAMPCKLDRDRGTGEPYLVATAVVPPDEERGVFDTEPDDFAVEGPADLEEPPGVDLPAESPADPPVEPEFHPHVVTSWTVLGPGDRSSPPIDERALSGLIRQVSTNKRYAGFLRGTRERCEGLMALLRLQMLANQVPFSVVSRGDEVEVALAGRPDPLAKSKRVTILVERGEGKERHRLPGTMELLGGRLRRPEDETGADVPDAGYLMDSGQSSQLEKQREALVRLAHCGGSPHLMRLASLLGPREEMRLAANPWSEDRIEFRDAKLDERQQEAVRKALATPDVCLIQGPPGTGKTRVIAEIVRQGARRGWKMLLVAPSHVAVDNVLERIGLEDEVSPVRCVKEEKRDKLPTDIQEFTYENRAQLLAEDSRKQVGRDLKELRTRQATLLTAVDTVERLRKLASEHNQEAETAAALEDRLAGLAVSVAAEFRAETDRLNARRDEGRRLVREAQDARTEAEALVRSLHERLADLGVGRLSGEDLGRTDAARRRVEAEFADRVVRAANAKDEVESDLAGAQGKAEAVGAELAASRRVLAELDAGRTPPEVAAVVAQAVAAVTQRHAPRVQELTDQFAGLEESLAAAQLALSTARARAGELESTMARRQEASGRPLYSRILYGAWWGSLVRDYGSELAAERQRESDITGQIERDTSESGVVEHRLGEARRALADEQRDVAACTRTEQHEEYRRRVPAFEEAESQIAERVQQCSRAVREAKSECDRIGHMRERAVREAIAATTEQIVSEEQVRLAVAVTETEEAGKQLRAAEADLAIREAAVTEHESRVRAVETKRQEELRQSLGETGIRIERARTTFQEMRAPLGRVVDPLPEMSPGSLQVAAATLTYQLSAIGPRLALVEQWDAHLSREAPALRDRLARYVNLVCSTTMGIATDDYFGDRGPFEEKEFDLLIVDEAGKVTELEFLVAATRARRWVLVGDHKQLPPYYDRVFDPVVKQADAARAEQGQPPLDADALRKSCFERLRERLQPPADSPSDDATPGPDRCVTLTVQRRMHPDLAVFISDVFYGGEYRSPTIPDGGPDPAFVADKTLTIEYFETPVTFVEVAPSRELRDGLETNLEEGPAGSHPLAPWAKHLPDKGYANLEEARRVVSALEGLVALAPVRGEQKAKDSGGRREPVVGVIAFYAGQVALIRQLILASDSLKAAVEGEDLLCEGVRVTVNSVDAFQGKECPVMLVSFTRSNRRAMVGFVDDANRLNVALSRAQKKLILFGDSQTLTNRSRRIPAPGEPDSRSATREREFFMKLVGYVAERGKHLKIFQLRT
ncbi:MAG: AAA family ATPase [Gemmataceae bacterium]|nr:AAA family ATPase [Gemmataceae bacterium]